MTQDENVYFGWDDDLQGGEDSFKILPEGVAYFKVLKYEKATHNPKEGSKITRACGRLDLTLELVSGVNGDKTTLVHSLFMVSSCAGFLKSMLQGIGQIPKSQESLNGVKINWMALEGATGKLVLNVDKYKVDKGPNAGKVYESNKVKRFIPQDDLTADDNEKINEFFNLEDAPF
jgi:hypothetical protein